MKNYKCDQVIKINEKVELLKNFKLILTAY